MRWFTTDWNEGDLTQEQVDQVRADYDAHTTSLRRDDPSLADLLDTDLHDGHVLEWGASDEQVSIRMVIGDAQKGYRFATLAYHGASFVGGLDEPTRLKLDDDQTEILYDEVDRDAGHFVHRMLLWPEGELVVRFTTVSVETSPATSADWERLEPLDEDFAELLARIAVAVGLPVVDWRDEHDRLALYAAAVQAPENASPLKSVVAREPVEGVATALLFAALDMYPDPADRDEWVAALPPDRRAFAAQRVRELRVLEAVLDGDAVSDEDVTGWPAWLQRRAVDCSTSRPLLERLAATGRSKKIRNIAADALRNRVRRAPGYGD